VYRDGQICLDILQDKWSPVLQVAKVLQQLQALLTDPNPSSPANGIAARQMQAGTFVAEARRITQLHATQRPQWLGELEDASKAAVEEKAKKAAEDAARKEAEEKARKEAEEKAKQEVLDKARREAEEKAQKEAEEKARKDEEEKARKVAGRMRGKQRKKRHRRRLRKRQGKKRGLGDDVLPVAKQPAKEWACGTCTFLNEPAKHVCEMCGANRTV